MFSLCSFGINKSATIHNVWVDFNTTYNGKNAIKVHCKFTVNGMKGKKGYLSIWFKDSSRRWHSVFGNVTSKEGIGYFESQYLPDYDNAIFYDFCYSICLDDLNFKTGTNNYQLIVCIADDLRNYLAQASPVSFSGTGTRPTNNRSSYNSQNSQTNNNSNQNIVKEWKEELGYGCFVEATQYSSGIITRVTWRPCPTCLGHTKCTQCIGNPGVCSICSGTTNIYKYDYYGYLQCTACMTNPGRCSVCGGSGECKVCKKSKYKGKVIGGSTTMTSDGRVLNKDHVNYNGNYGNSSSSSSEYNTNKQCIYCGGSGINPNPCTGGCRTAFQAPYTVNGAGQRCHICNNGTFHHHDRCFHCNVPSR